MNFLEPIIRHPLRHNPEMFSGDDFGYRNVPSREGNEPMVVLQNSTNIILRPVYAGYESTNGQINTAASLPGTGEIMYVRQAVAHCLEYAASFIGAQGNNKLIVLDGFRNFQTQAAGFSRLFMESLKFDRSNAAKYDALTLADGIFSFVDIDMTLVTDSPLTVGDCMSLAERVHWNATPEQIRQELLTWAANLALYIKSTGRDPDIINMSYWWEKLDKYWADLFRFNNNTHTWGGAIDILLGEEREINGIKTWVPINHVPFDHMWPESAIDFLENIANWGLYRATARKAWAIRDYLISIDIDPDSISDKQFEKWRNGIRLLTNTMTGMGATYYCNENWHFNVSNEVRDPKNPNQIVYTWSCSSIQVNTWNSCHAILIHGPQWIQTFTWIGAHEKLGLK